MIRFVMLPLLGVIASAALASDVSRGAFAVEHLTVPRVTLIDQYAQEQLFHGPLTEGQVLVINFNYTTCESICPIGNDVMAELDGMLPAEAPVRLMSITIDPGRDTPAQMRKAAKTFGASERWAWLTGNPGEVSRLLAAFDADYANILLHEPVFLVGDLDTHQFYRSQSMPSPEELAGLVGRLIR